MTLGEDMRFLTKYSRRVDPYSCAFKIDVKHWRQKQFHENKAAILSFYVRDALNIQIRFQFFLKLLTA